MKAFLFILDDIHTQGSLSRALAYGGNIRFV